MSEDELLAKAFCNMLIMTKPGTRKAVYDTPSKTSTRPSKTCPKINMYIMAVNTGAATV
jgi:hypothetical protein